MLDGKSLSIKINANVRADRGGGGGLRWTLVPRSLKCVAFFNLPATDVPGAPHSPRHPISDRQGELASECLIYITYYVRIGSLLKQKKSNALHTRPAYHGPRPRRVRSSLVVRPSLFSFSSLSLGTRWGKTILGNAWHHGTDHDQSSLPLYSII